MPTRRRRALITAALVTVLALLVAACGDGASDGSTREEADASPTGEYAYDDVHGAAEHMEVWAAELAASLDEHADLGGDPQSPAAELLAGLDFTLREHVATTVAVMEAQAEQDDDPFTSLREAVDHVAHVADSLAVPFAETVVPVVRSTALGSDYVRSVTTGGGCDV